MKNRQSFLTIYIYIYTISGKLKSPKKKRGGISYENYQVNMENKES